MRETRGPHPDNRSVINPPFLQAYFFHMTIPSSITSLVKQACSQQKIYIHAPIMAGGKEALAVIIKNSALQTLLIQFCFSSANGWHLVLLTMDDSFQRNCCASRGYLEGNEGFLAYCSSSILAMSLCNIINSLTGAWCSLFPSWLPMSHLVPMVTSRNKHLFHQDKEGAPNVETGGSAHSV